MSDLVASLWITLIGMGLVFIGILLLWGLMEAVVRITARYAPDKSSEEEADADSETEAAPAGGPEGLPAPAASQKRRAAAVAVAIALALRKPAARLSLPLERIHAGASSSAWQSVTRASQLNHPTQIARKSRGSVR
jgi:Na+-transporting methylmalonyl-CoA/oxaloacetate decarboxylase gamma subunit